MNNPYNPFTYAQGYDMGDNGSTPTYLQSSPLDGGQHLPNIYPPLGSDENYDIPSSSTMPTIPLGDAQPVPATSWSQKLFPNGASSDDFINLGKTALGIYGATRPIPVDSKSQAWMDYLNRSKILSNQGLTPEEYSLTNRNATNAYAADLDSIRNASGGNASTYLGNAGRAISGLYDAKAKIAAEDANLHRQNLLQYGNVLGQDNSLNRQLFLDKYNQALENKKSGAALASDALYNIHNKEMYNKQYGEGSAYKKWLQAQIADTEASTEAKKTNEAAILEYLHKLSTQQQFTPAPSRNVLYPGVPASPEQGTGAYVSYPPINTY